VYPNPAGNHPISIAALKEKYIQLSANKNTKLEMNKKK
jgi:hypothetical protein